MRKILLLSLLVLSLAAACDNTEKERDALMATAAGLEQSGKFAEAREQAQKALALAPDYGQAYLIIARSHMGEKNTDEALKSYSRVHELMPDNLEALENMARLNLLKGELALADKYVGMAAALSPDSLELKIVQAGVHMRRQEYDKAEPLLRQALEKAPGNEEALIGLASIALNKGKQDEAKDMLEKAVNEQKISSAAILSMLSNIAIDNNDLSSAEGYIKRLMEISEDDEQLVLQLAAIYQIGNREKDVAELLSSYLEKKPDAINVRTRLAELSLGAGKYDEALKIVNAAPEDNPKIRLLRAGVITQSGKVEESIPMLRGIINDAAADKETVSAAYMGLASIFVQQNKPDEAEKELSSLLRLDPDNIQALFMRSGLYFNKRNFIDSKTDMERVVKLSPNDPSAHLGLADVLNASGDSEKAEQIISEVIARFPEYPQAYLTMANFQIMRGAPEAALMTLDIGKTATKNNMDLAMARADILVNLKRYDDAKKDLEEFAKDNPNMEIPTRLRLAEVEIARSRFGAAAQVYEGILKDNPDVQAAAEGYLHAMISAKKIKEAQAFAAKRSKERPDDPMAAYLLGEIALLNKDAAAGEKAFKRALELNTAWEQPLTRLAQLYTLTNRLPDAIKLCEEMLAKDPKSVSPAVLLAILLEQKGDLDEAEKQYRKVLDMHQDNLLASNNLAYLLSRHKNTKARLQEAEILAKNSTASGAPATYDTLGWIQYQLGSNKDAEANIRKAYEDLKDSPTIAYHLAAVLATFDKDEEKIREAMALLEEITKAKTQDFPQKHDARQLLTKLGDANPKIKAQQGAAGDKAASAKPEGAKPKPDASPKPKPEAGAKPKPDAKPKPKPEAGGKPKPKPEAASKPAGDKPKP